jgi:hypothetical protein
MRHQLHVPAAGVRNVCEGADAPTGIVGYIPFENRHPAGNDVHQTLHGAQRTAGFSSRELVAGHPLQPSSAPAKPRVFYGSVTTLALGIGATASLFSVVDAVVLQPLPIPKSHELVQVLDSRRGEARQRGPGTA